MSTSIRTILNSGLQALLIVLLLVICVIVFVCAWLAIAVLCQCRAGWMPLVAALIVIVTLRVAGMRSGTPRALLAMFATAVSIALGEWLVAALPIALEMGLFPLEAAHRIGADFCWMLLNLGNTPLDWLCVVVALVIAACLGR